MNAPVLAGRDPRHRRRGRGARHVRAGARLHRRGDHARGAVRRAQHRARQAHRRGRGEAGGRARRVRGADARDYEALAGDGEAMGIPPDSVDKIADVREAGLRSLEIIQRAGVKMGFGTDLLGESHRLQSDEFLIRAEVMSNADVLRSATVVGAEIVGMAGRLGQLVPGAFADLLVVDGRSARGPVVPGGSGRADQARDEEREGLLQRDALIAPRSRSCADPALPVRSRRPSGGSDQRSVGALFHARPPRHRPVVRPVHRLDPLAHRPRDDLVVQRDVAVRRPSCSFSASRDRRVALLLVGLDLDLRRSARRPSALL